MNAGTIESGEALQESASHKRIVYRSGSTAREGEPGQVVILFALMSIVFIGMLALSVDVGYLLTERRGVQAAADSAALAAAVAAYQSDSANIESSATDYAIENAGVTSDDVDFQSPPASGEYAGESDYFQVTVRKDVQRFFLGAVYTGDWSVAASAVAGVEVEGESTGLLARNPDEGGIVTNGSSKIKVVGASVISNYKIETHGTTIIDATHAINANDGFDKNGSTTFIAHKQNEGAPEVPDPLADKIDPPVLPGFPGNIVPNVSGGTSRACYEKPKWSPPPGPADYIAPPGGLYTGGGGNCVTINGAPGGNYIFPDANYKFTGGAGLNLPYQDVRLDGGTWNFDGGAGINVNGTTNYFEMREGEYSFTRGATLKLTGSNNNNHLCGGASDYTDCTFYFSGGGGIEGGGSLGIRLYPGTYIFDGGPGLVMGGSSVLIFEPGIYQFWFRNGADLHFHGSSRIDAAEDIWVQGYFYGSAGNPSDLLMAGSTKLNLPSGEYYFDGSRMINKGSSEIRGKEVFLYFTNGGHMFSDGSAGFSFTAPDWEIYPGYYPGVYIYSDRDNTATFQWNGSSSEASEGIVYLPSSPLHREGSSNGLQWRGQLIVDRLILGGSNETQIEYVEYVETEIPAVYLVE